MNITLYPLADYNNGVLNPFTVDLDNVSTLEEYLQEIAKGLYDNSSAEYSNVDSTGCKDCGHVALSQELTKCPECGSDNVECKPTNEEWIVCDYEDIPKSLVNEYDLDSEFWEYKELVDFGGLDIDIINAGIALGIDIDKIEEAYQGYYDSAEEFAEEFADGIGAIPDNLDWPLMHIDWKLAARDLMYDFQEENGYYFSRNY